ncbi:MAG: nitroreductase family deazaflavin-dependent oxidoreductase [Acidimicrobiia bacterium]|nr:nitroreductase family deazaflavin-dependent oxidoreductase [Acidimicrobiia bacterium]
MPWSRQLPRFNRAMAQVVGSVLNPISRVIASWFPGWGNIVHRGRNSGRIYRTPVFVFRRSEDEYVIALTYGPDSQWVKNVLAAGGCALETRAKHHKMTSPRLYRDRSRKDMPLVIAGMLTLLGVDDFMSLSLRSGEEAPGDPDLELGG